MVTRIGCTGGVLHGDTCIYDLLKLSGFRPAAWPSPGSDVLGFGRFIYRGGLGMWVV